MGLFRLYDSSERHQSNQDPFPAFSPTVCPAGGVGKAAVQFHHVHPPLCKGLGVFLDVVRRRPGVALAGGGPQVGVDAKL